MEQANPYSAPSATISDIENDSGFGDLKIFTTQGRIGRLRYLMYTLGVAFIGLVIIMAIGAVLPGAAGILIIIFYAVVLTVTIFLTIQRCHDFNASGWLSLALLIPVVSLIFYFIPGTKGSNNYGLQPPPNSKLIRVTAFLLIAIFIIGILTAIALPVIDSYMTQPAVG